MAEITRMLVANIRRQFFFAFATTASTRCLVQNFELKATSHSTIFDIPMRPLREDQKHRHRFTLKESPQLP